VLSHSGIKRCIIILGPSSKRVEQENGVLVASSQQLFSGVVEEENVSVVEWVSDLESVDSISLSLLNLVVDFLGCESVVVKAVVEFDLLDKSSS
jgi:hypothetical protein